jgi:hypothetical protein
MTKLSGGPLGPIGVLLTPTPFLARPSPSRKVAFFGRAQAVDSERKVVYRFTKIYLPDLGLPMST